jgi:Zn-dependent peptidase ImmA (M78 family)
MKPKCLSAAQIEVVHAAEFRRRYAQGVMGWLDIEAVLEHDVGLQIIPRKHLTRRTEKKAWLSADGRSIYVDEDLMCDSETEYRFTIAHEGAHAVLHANLLPQSPLSSQEAFWAYHNRLSERDEYFLEWQARQFAGQVLVPPGELSGMFSSAARRALRSVGMCPAAELYAENEVAAHFGVTNMCAGVRISQDHLWRAFGMAA